MELLGAPVADSIVIGVSSLISLFTGWWGAKKAERDQIVKMSEMLTQMNTELREQLRIQEENCHHENGELKERVKLLEDKIFELQNK